MEKLFGAAGVKIRVVVELFGTQNTRPSGSKTPPTKAAEPGYVPVGVVSVSVTGL